MPRIRGFRDPKTLRHLPRDVGAQALDALKPVTSSNNIWTSRPSAEDLDRLRPWVARTTALHLRRNRRKLPLSPNHGFVVAVKDNIITNHLPSSCASEILRDYVAPRQATVVKLMEDAGMAIIGKTNMDEFGMGSHTMNSAFGAMHQPYSHLSVGGSSGGSGLAVGLKQCHVALGTDTGGSVRLPAAYLGLFGFKPSYGRISRYGVVPYANSLDTVGLLGRHPLDLWLLFNILDHPDANDPTCLTAASRERIKAVRNTNIALTRGAHSRGRLRVQTSSSAFSKTHTLNEIYVAARRTPATPRHLLSDYRRLRRIGIPKDYNIEELQPEVRNAWVGTIAILRGLGHQICEVDLPMTRHALSAYYILAPAEASSNLAKYDGVRYGPVRDEVSGDTDAGVLYSAHRGQLFGEEVKRRILLGAFSLSAGAIDNYFLQAQRVRRLVQDDFNQIFRMAHPLIEGSARVPNGVDYILCPTAPTVPPQVRQVAEQESPVETYMNDVFTVPASLAGLPAYSFPAPPTPGRRRADDTRSVGMQLIGQYGDDVGVLQFVASAIHARLEWGEHGAVRPPREGHGVD